MILLHRSLPWLLQAETHGTNLEHRTWSQTAWDQILTIPLGCWEFVDVRHSPGLQPGLSGFNLGWIYISQNVWYSAQHITGAQEIWNEWLCFGMLPGKDLVKTHNWFSLLFSLGSNPPSGVFQSPFQMERTFSGDIYRNVPKEKQLHLFFSDSTFPSLEKFLYHEPPTYPLSKQIVECLPWCLTIVSWMASKADSSAGRPLGPLVLSPVLSNGGTSLRVSSIPTHTSHICSPDFLFIQPFS